MTKIFKNVLDKIGDGLAMAFAIFLVIMLSPTIISVLAYFGIKALLTRYWIRRRRDPVYDLVIKDLEDNNWGGAETKEDFINIFKLVSGTIANLSGAKQDSVVYDGFSIFDNPTQIKDWTELNLSQTLRTKHAEIMLTFKFGAIYNEDQEKVIVEPEDGDDIVSATAQGQFCRLNVTVKNIADQSQSLDSDSQYLFNAKGQKYSSDSTATLYAAPDSSSWYTDINPGNSVTGDIIFDIPKDQVPATAEMHDSAFSGGVSVGLQ
jgi:hypothetical protein